MKHRPINLEKVQSITRVPVNEIKPNDLQSREMPLPARDKSEIMPEFTQTSANERDGESSAGSDTTVPFRVRKTAADIFHGISMETQLCNTLPKRKGTLYLQIAKRG